VKAAKAIEEQKEKRAENMRKKRTEMSEEKVNNFQSKLIGLKQKEKPERPRSGDNKQINSTFAQENTHHAPETARDLQN